MIQTIKSFITNTVLASLLLVPVFALAPAVANAQNELTDGLCAGVNLDVTKSTGCDPADGDAEGKVNNLIKQIINIFSLVVGIVAVIMIIIGGLKYITSSGDSGNISSAKSTILYAIIGLVVVALAQFIVKFVLSKATSA